MGYRLHSTEQQTPTLTVAGAYSSGDLVGTKLSFVNLVRPQAGGTIESVVLTDLAKQDKACDIVLWLADPSATTFTDNSELQINDADLPNILGVIKLAATDYFDFKDNSVACKNLIGLGFSIPAGQILYAAIVARDTPTYAAGDVKLRLNVLQDN